MTAVASDLTLPTPEDAGHIRQSTRYRRVVCQQGNEFESQIYNLLRDCATDPEVAAAVEEVVFLDLGKAKKLAFPGRKQTAKDEAVRDEALEAAKNASKDSVFRDAVAASSYIDQPDEWLASLEWLRPDLIRARDQGDGILFVFSPLRQLLGPPDYLARVRSSIMLLILCPNIQSIVFSEGGSSYYVRHFLKTNNFATMSGQYLKNVRNVTILSGSHNCFAHEDYIGTDPLGTLTLFHRLQALEKVALHGLAENPDGMYFTFWPPFSSDIKRLHLVHDGSHQDIVFAMVRMAKRLEEFSMIHGGRRMNGGYTASITSMLIGKALICHKSTLRILNLDVNEVAAFVDWGEREPSPSFQGYLEQERNLYISDEWFKRDRANFLDGELFEADVAVDRAKFGATMGPLRDFTALTHLSISIQLLLGPERVPAPFRLVDALPASLEHLVIRGYGRGEDAHYDEQVDELVALRDQRLPRLAAVEGVDAKIWNSTTFNVYGRRDYEPISRDYDCTDGEAGSLFGNHQRELRQLADSESFQKCIWSDKIDEAWKRAGDREAE